MRVGRFCWVPPPSPSVKRGFGRYHREQHRAFGDGGPSYSGVAEIWKIWKGKQDLGYEPDGRGQSAEQQPPDGRIREAL